jgi:hypothetical protein
VISSVEWPWFVSQSEEMFLAAHGFVNAKSWTMKLDRVIGSIFLYDRSIEIGDAKTHGSSLNPHSQCGGVKTHRRSIFVGDYGHTLRPCTGKDRPGGIFRKVTLWPHPDPQNVLPESRDLHNGVAAMDLDAIAK